ncbi:unnamed protein product [Meganyctiphanes norvegica]|uniref:ER membrane protein complex subunit 1 n=1 Tax=Meganyctiphanes norvegica TaxID=48144 RepID=A0AAV2RB33_MEGNR
MASIASIESVDLPTTPYYQDQIYEPSGMFGSFFHRVRTQWIHTIGWFGRAFGSQDSFDPHQPSIVRDAFNLRKMLIIVTNSGKILGVDSWNGDIIWSLFVREMAPLNGGKLLIYQQRTVAHFPQPPQCVVIGKHKHSGDGLLVVVNPITGELLGGSYGAGIINLGFKLHQALIIQYMDQFYLKPVVLIDSNQNVKVFPSSGEAVVLEHGKQLYVHLAHHDSSILKGYSFAYSKPGALLLTEVWRITLGGGPITGVYGKESNELVHSPGRVLADRSVLYKYVNPNLVVVTTQGYDHINKNTLTVHLVDTVTGTVIESVSHKRVSGPVHIVHSENWVVYTCFNEKYRRSEVTSLELFEGLTQANSTAFSSFSVRATPPILEKQAFIIPQGVQAASHTTTEKGITTKFLLFALQSGNILQLSKYFLDPRRPVSASAPREEGLIPYMPELPLPPQEMINYNNTLPRVNAIFTATTGLESTCLVLVYGLDVFYTRVFPSKMFDMLKDDFDHYLIVGALLALLTGALVARRMAQRKALNQAWK